MAAQVWTYLCNTPPGVEGGTPTGCAWTAVPAEVYQTGGYSKEQYDALFGAVMVIVCLIIAFALIKKAIEQ